MAEAKNRETEQAPEWGQDPDSRLRELKRQQAVAANVGDSKENDRLQREIDAINVDLGRKDKAETKSDKATS